MDDATLCDWCSAPAETTDDEGDPCCLPCALLPGPESAPDERTERTERAVALLGLRWRREVAEC